MAPVDGSLVGARPKLLKPAEAMAELDGLNGDADASWTTSTPLSNLLSPSEDILFVREEPVASPVVAGGAGDVVVAGSLVAGAPWSRAWSPASLTRAGPLSISAVTAGSDKLTTRESLRRHSRGRAAQ